jgi:hypothetical protein
MPFLPGVAVVFLGLAGGDKNVAKQVATLVKDLHLPVKSVPAQTLKTLTHHASGSRELVQKLHVDGAVGFEVAGRTLRVVIYGGDGSLKTLSETSLGKAGLSRDDLSVLRTNLADDVGSIKATHDDDATITDDNDAAPAVAPPPAAKAAPAVKAAPPVAKPAAPVAKPAPAPAAAPAQLDDEDPFAAPAKKAPAAAKPMPAGRPVQSDDDESPIVPAKKKSAAAPAPAPKPADDDESPLPAPAKRTAQAAPKHEEVAAADDADAPAGDEASGETVDVSEVEALTASAGTEQPVTQAAASLHLGVSLGLGLAGRNFAPGPATVAPYSSRPVGTIAGEGYISPTARTTVAIRGERTLMMSTPVGETMATTAMSRWEAAGRYTAVHGGKVEIAPMLGFGRRTFVIHSTNPSRSPDGDYNYLIAGAAGSVAIGKRVTLRTSVALEPVLFGAEPTETAFGEASRWATDVDGGLEVRLNEHVLARLAADYQRFMWSWDMAGARGAGGAVDSYVSGVLSLGADY